MSLTYNGLIGQLECGNCGLKARHGKSGSRVCPGCGESFETEKVKMDNRIRDIGRFIRAHESCNSITEAFFDDEQITLICPENHMDDNGYFRGESVLRINAEEYWSARASSGYDRSESDRARGSDN